MSISGTEGSTTGTIPVATFTDANPNATASDFTAALGDGAPTLHRADTVLDNSGDTIDFSSGAFQNLVLNGAVIEGGVLITGPEGIINSPGDVDVGIISSPGGPDASLANVLDLVTVLGGLTLEPGTSLEVSGSISGAITVDSSAYLFICGDYTVENLTLNGGNLDGGVLVPFSGGRLIIPPDGLLQGYGEIGGSPLGGFMSLENEGTIDSDINGQLLAINNINFSNDGLVEATNGGKMDLAGPVTGGGQFLIGQAATLEFGGPTAEVVTFESGGGGTLYLDKATGFSGTVTGLGQADFIELADFAFSSHPVIMNVTGTGAAGSTTDVTIADGSQTTTLHLLNQFAGEYPTASTMYHLESDNPSSTTAGTLFTTVVNPGVFTLTTLVTFSGANGAEPFGSLIADAHGDLFGTTVYGGANITTNAPRGYGTVFEIAKTADGYASTPTTLVSFNGTNGAFPQSNSYGSISLIADAQGDLFGTTGGGGASGDGTAFEIAKTADGYASTPTTLVSFNGANGSGPTSLIADAHGDLFGTTAGGGAYGVYGYGTVFEIAKTADGYASTPTTLVSFNHVDGDWGARPDRRRPRQPIRHNILGRSVRPVRLRHGIRDRQDRRRLRQHPHHPGQFQRRQRFRADQLDSRCPRRPVRYNGIRRQLEDERAVRRRHGVRDRQDRRRLRQHPHHPGHFQRH